jgi:hypothetical protein
MRMSHGISRRISNFRDICSSPHNPLYLYAIQDRRVSACTPALYAWKDLIEQVLTPKQAPPADALQSTQQPLARGLRHYPSDRSVLAHLSIVKLLGNGFAKIVRSFK